MENAAETLSDTSSENGYIPEVRSRQWSSRKERTGSDHFWPKTWRRSSRDVRRANSGFIIVFAVHHRSRLCPRSIRHPNLIGWGARGLSPWFRTLTQGEYDQSLDSLPVSTAKALHRPFRTSSVK